MAVSRRRCPSCGGEVLHGFVDGKPATACIGCARVFYDATPEPEQPRGRKQPEADVERMFDACARERGWTVLSTSRRRKGAHCERCGNFVRPQGGDGVSKGVPDRLLRKSDMPPYLWYGVELKGSHTRLSPEQKELADAGAIIIARSYADFARAIGEIPCEEDQTR